MTREQAEFIKDLRINQEATFRVVANEYINKYSNMNCIDNRQEFGNDLCWSACELLGENWEENGWN
jgi:hypothetical protein